MGHGGSEVQDTILCPAFNQKFGFFVNVSGSMVVPDDDVVFKNTCGIAGGGN